MQRTPPTRRLPRRARRATLVVHVATSVGWLGVTLCLLALSVTATTTASDAATEAAYRSMKVFGDWLIAPLALTTLLTGLALSLYGHWGLARHRWVYTKFWVTLAAATASVFVFRTKIDGAVAAVTAGEPVDVPGLLAPPIVSLGAYAFTTTLSVLKPWGLTARGRRQRSAVRADRAAPPEPGSARPRAGEPARTGEAG